MMELPFTYHIEKKSVRHARIKITENREVNLVIPETFSEEEIRQLLIEKTEWIRNKLAFFQKEETELPIEIPKAHILYLGEPHPKPEGDILKWYRKEAKNYLTKRINYLARKFDLNYNRIFIRESKTKWGNCSKEKNISLNWRLIKAPKEVVDYVILHELCHTVILKHTQAFWLKLSLVCPDYQQQRNWLEKYGKGLFKDYPFG